MSKVIATILNLKDNFSPALKQAQSNANSFREMLKKDTSSVKELSKTSETLGKIKGAIAGAFAGLAIGEAVKQSIDLASSLTEVQNVVDTTFGKSASQIDAWSKSAINNFGLSELQAKQYTGTLGAMLKSSGVTGDAMMNMSEKLVGLSGDLASFYNLPIDEAMEKIRSGISGETMPLKQLGINMDVANLSAFALKEGIHKTYQQMSQAEQTTLRYNYLMSVTKDMQGDFAKTSGTFANQLRIAKTNLAQTGATIASHLLPYLNTGLQYFNKFLDVLPKIGDVLGKAFKADTAEQGIQIISGAVHDFLFGKLPNDVTEAITTLVNTVGNDLADLKKPFMDLGKSIATLFSTITGNKDAKDVANKVIPAITTALDDALKALKKVLQGFKDIFDWVNKNWGTLDPIVKGLATTLGIVTLAIYGVRSAMMAWDAIIVITEILTAPFTIVILGIIAIVAMLSIAIYAVVDDYNDCQEKLSGIWENIKSIFYSGVNFCIDRINDLIDALNFLDGIDLPDSLGGGRIGFGKIDHIGKVGLKNNTNSKNSPAAPNHKKVTAYATGTQYYDGRQAITDERGGEMKIQPNGTKIIPHDLSEKMINKNDKGINIYVTVQGNVIGNEEFVDYAGNVIANKVKLALTNI